MSDPFFDAIKANMAASINPEAKAMREAMVSFVQEQQHQLLVTKAQSMLDISALLTQATDNGKHPAVIAGLEKILAKMAQ